MKQNLLLLTASLLFCFSIAELYSSKKVKEKLHYNFTKAGNKREFIEFINYHTKSLHHLKNQNYYNINNPKQLIYSEIGKGEKTILIQGDSWAELLELREESKDMIFQKSLDENIKFVMGGTSSYSPSLMSAQLNTLRYDFNINPEIIIAIIDQTDLGDELCRYKNLRKTVNGRLIVKPNQAGAPDFYTQHIAFSKYEILSSMLPATIKLIKYEIFNYQTNQRIKSLPIKCNYDNILGILKRGINVDDKEYWDLVLNEYIENVFSESSTKNLILITHPHKNHFTGEYSLNIYDLINANIKKSKYFNQITMVNTDKNELINKIEIDEIFIHNDKYSHLTTDYIVKFYLPKIFNSIFKS